MGVSLETAGKPVETVSWPSQTNLSVPNPPSKNDPFLSEITPKHHVLPPKPAGPKALRPGEKVLLQMVAQPHTQ